MASHDLYINIYILQVFQTSKCWMDSSVLSTIVIRIQNDHHHSGISRVEDNVIVVTYVNLINVDAAQCSLDESENPGPLAPCQEHNGERGHNSNIVAKLECSGQDYVCGNCRTVLKPKEESDLEKQLNLQRIQHQIELEALQHEQRMKHLRTLLLN